MSRQTDWLKFGEYSLKIKNDHMKLPLDQCSFVALKYKEFGYYWTFESKSKEEYTFRCNGYKTACKCDSKILVTIQRNSDLHSISPSFQLKTDHCEECRKTRQKNSNENKDKWTEKADLIVNHFSFMTRNQIKIYFGFDNDELDKVFNRIKTLKKGNVYYNLDKLLDKEKRYKLVTKNSDEEIIIFHQKWSFDVIRKSDTFYVDGTFSAVIDGYKQLFVIHAGIDYYYFTVLLILLKNKETATYEDMMKRIQKDGKEHFKDFDILERSIQFVCDFETGILALKNIFPNIEFIGCSFHAKRQC